MTNWLKSPTHQILVLLIIVTSFLHLFRLDFPTAYVFDEVYHAFTAKEYLTGSTKAWDPWATPPAGVAFEWTHPPLAKEMMTISMFIVNSTNAWAWRLPGALLGILTIFLVYKIALVLFKKETIALLSATIFSFEGLNLVQSRTGMNDIYFVTFMLLSVLFYLLATTKASLRSEKSYLRRNYEFFLSALFLGLSLSSKWTAIYLFGFFAILIIRNRQFKQIPYFLLVPPVVYLASYMPYFLLGFDFAQFKELQRQMWWYHTNLKASHDYSSPWWSWPFNLYPVWYYVQYFPNNFMANIFASGNPVVFWAGLWGIVFSLWEIIKKRVFSLAIVILGFLVFLLPWSVSPRIMFLYHYSPCIPFLSIALGYQINHLFEKGDKKLAYAFLGLMILGFLIFYPFLTGIPLPKEISLFFFHTNLTKNPF